MKVAVIGGGLAGCALARALKRGGADAALYEAEETLAPGASGHMRGLYNPRFTAERTAQSDFFVAAYSLAVREFSSMADVDWGPCGTLHLMCDEKKISRFPRTFKNWRWEPEHMQLLDKEAASVVAGVELSHAALYLPDAGTISPKKLCDYYTKGVEVRLNTRIEALEEVSESHDAVVLACGAGARAFAQDLPLNTVRGQVTDVAAHAFSKKLKSCLCFGGYITPASDAGVHVLGATFQRWLDHSEPMVEDNAQNIAKLAEIVPALADGLKVVGHRAAVRVASRDHFPLVGALPGHDNVYISVAHGSHGVISSLMSAEILGDMILGRPYSLGRETVEALSPARFL